MLVLKFGGSSVKDDKCISKVVKIVKDKTKNEKNLVVVCSAMGGITDLLIEMGRRAEAGDESYQKLLNEFSKRHLYTAKKLLSSSTYKEVEKVLKTNHEVLFNLLKGVYLVREASARTEAYILSFGERNSNYIIAKAFNENKIQTEYCDARNLISTDNEYLNATVNTSKTRKNIKKYFRNNTNKCTVVTGFIASEKGGLTTVLGRGGSDFTASILAAELDAHTLEIWTDVDGVLSTDPRKVKEAFSLKKLSYLEAMELSHFGAKVIYPPTIRPVMDKSIPIYIKNTFNPSHPGTKIHVKGNDSKHQLTGISAINDISLITLEGSGMQGVPGIAARLFSVLYTAQINIILITQASSEHSITFAIASKDQKTAVSSIKTVFAQELKSKTINPIKKESGFSIVAAVGEKMNHQIGIAGQLFSILGKNKINVHVIAQGSSELNISFVIKTKKLSKALKVIHKRFFRI